MVLNPLGLSLQDVGWAIETPGVAPVRLPALGLLAAPLPCPSPSAGTLGLGSRGRVALSTQSVDTGFLVYRAGPGPLVLMSPSVRGVEGPNCAVVGREG